MVNRGTALTQGQLAEFVGAGTKALILVSARLDPKCVHHWAERGQAMEQAFLSVLILQEETDLQPGFVSVPEDNEWFDLGVDNTIDPMDVVTSAGYTKDDWKCLGPEFKDKETYRAKLVRLGHVRNLAEARKKADKMDCRLVEGQARESFKAKFPKPDGKGPVVFGGSEWQSPYGRARVACLHDFGVGWRSSFRWSGRGFDDGCRWLVVSK